MLKPSAPPRWKIVTSVPPSRSALVKEVWRLMRLAALKRGGGQEHGQASPGGLIGRAFLFVGLAAENGGDQCFIASHGGGEILLQARAGDFVGHQVHRKIPPPKECASPV